MSAIAIDSLNVKWIGTSWNGFARFDDATWTTFDSSNSLLENNHINDIAIDPNGSVWACAGMMYYMGCLVNYSDTGLAVFNVFNSDLPYNHTTAIAIDTNGNKWVGTYFEMGMGVLVKYDGVIWTEYPHPNMLCCPINSIAVDKNNYIWLGTDYGLAKFDGDTTWVVYKSSNSPLPVNGINSIVIDLEYNMWISTKNGGLCKVVNDTNWTIYNTTNSELPSDWVNDLAIDSAGNLWIGTSNGLVKFDGSLWSQTINTLNSPLPSNNVYAITIDSNDYKWIGTGGGLAVYKNDQVIVDYELGNFNYLSSCLGDSSFFSDITPDSTHFWQWNFGDSASGSYNTSNLQNPSHLFTSSGTFNVTFIVSYQQDTDTVVQQIVINPKPSALITGASEICAGLTIVLTASGGNFYSWNTGQTADMIAVTPLVNTSYMVTVTNNFGCLDLDTFSVTVNQLPVLNLGGDTSICQGCSLIIDAGSGFASYYWSTGESTQTINIDSSGTYTVTVTDINNCQKSGSITVSVLVGVLEEKQSRKGTISVYPNPTYGPVYLTSLSLDLRGGYQLSVYNILGEIVYESSPSEIYNFMVDMSPFKNGIYILKILINQDIYITKIVKSDPNIPQ